jgi:hypothetical protein
MPEERIVAVRLAQSCGQWEGMYDTFRDFECLLDELIAEMGIRARSKCTEMPAPIPMNLNASPHGHVPKKRIFRRS